MGGCSIAYAATFNADRTSRHSTAEYVHEICDTASMLKRNLDAADTSTVCAQDELRWTACSYKTDSNQRGVALL